MNTTRKADPLEARCREMAVAEGNDPDKRMPYGEKRTQPTWCLYRDAARAERTKEALAAVAQSEAVMGQPERYRGAPLLVLGPHQEQTIEQMKNCMSVGNVVGGVICADGHLGYAQPVGGVIAYEGQISVSGVGFDIGCGNMAVKLDIRKDEIDGDGWEDIYRRIGAEISFGVGRSNETRVEHDLFDFSTWASSLMHDFKDKARAQLGTVGSGNHYIDLFTDPDGHIWIGVHFGSRGLGHTTATRAIKRAGGKDGIHVPPVVLDDSSDQGQTYLAGMTLAGAYAYAGREWVVDRVRKIIGGSVLDTVHNHHNFAWHEQGHWVVRKGATPAHPGQRGFVGGSMGEDAVIVKGTGGVIAAAGWHSTIHGAGRNFGRKEAKRRFTKDEMDGWLSRAGVRLFGGDLDESPMAYKRLPEVLVHHRDSIEVETSLKPFAVFMAGDGSFDPYKD